MKPVLGIVTLSALLFFASCGEKECNDIAAVISINLDEVNAVDPLATGRIVKLESSDSSLIYDVCALEEIGNRFIINSRDYLRAYDAFTGNFLGDLGRHGDRPGDFSYIANMWTTGDTLHVYDCNTCRILHYDSSGTYLKSDSPFADAASVAGESPRVYIRDNGLGTVYTVNSWSGGSTDSNPLLTAYTGHNERIGAVTGREVQEGSFMPDCFHADTAHERLLVWVPLRDTIFEVRDRHIQPAYTFNFGKNSFPPELQRHQHLSERLHCFNSMPTLTASAIRFIQARGNRLYFTFATNDGLWYLGCYDSTTAESKVFHFTTADGDIRQEPFFKLSGDSALVELRNHSDATANPYICKFPLDVLQ